MIVRAFNFDKLNDEQAELLLALWSSNKHAEAKELLLAANVVECRTCLDNTSYTRWMQWWINSLKID